MIKPWAELGVVVAIFPKEESFLRWLPSLGLPLCISTKLYLDPE